MMKVHYYDSLKEIKKIINYDFNQFLSKIGQLLSLNEPELFIYEYLTNNKEYYILNEENYEKFLDDSVTDIFVYSSIEETRSYNQNNNVIEVKNQGEEEPEFYEDDNNEENNDLYYNKALEEKIKQNIINIQKEKIRSSKIQKEEEEKQKKQNQNEIIIKNNNVENNMENNEIIDIINNKFEEFKENLINESKVQATQIMMETKLKIEENKEETIETPCSVEKHSGTVCNGCGLFNIQGVRYKCVECADFDYCEQCFKEKKNVHGHPFYKLRFIIE